MDQLLLQKYADFAVQVGVNVQKGQTLIIQCPVEGAFFARKCAEAAYRAGAGEVVVKYGDEQVDRLTMQYASEQTLCSVNPYLLRSYLDYAEAEGGACVLNIVARDPEIYAGLDTAKINKANLARRAALKEWQEDTMNNLVQWSIVAIPSPAWACKVFPGLEAAPAMEKLWQVIFDVCRVTGGDPVGEWQRHVAATAARRDKLNALDLASVRLQSANGTDLTVGLADDSVWAGASSVSAKGVGFIANIPTEEVFTAPHRDRVDGVVKGTKPYAYNGQLIEGFSVTFQNGKVVAHSAEKGEELLGELLDSDEGARRIGELALVPASSPINRSGVLFLNTLFDENAACHIAFGRGYPENVRGGETMTAEQLLQKGLNASQIHEDVMVGSPDMRITGITRTGEQVLIFENGEWAL